MAYLRSCGPEVPNNMIGSPTKGWGKMTTMVFSEGRTAGYYGEGKSTNPYCKGWARLAESPRADDWNRGYDYGERLRTASPADLMRALIETPAGSAATGGGCSNRSYATATVPARGELRN